VCGQASLPDRNANWEHQVGRRYELVQFPLRALFVLTLAVGLLATVARWLASRDDVVVLSIAIVMGFVVGFGTVWIVHNVHITSLLMTLLLASAVCGLWLSSRDVGYGMGLVVGAIAAFRGLDWLNAVLSFCGVSISITESDSR
jgi:hypothetical protein